MGHCIGANQKAITLNTKPLTVIGDTVKPAYPSIEDMIQVERLRARKEIKSRRNQVSKKDERDSMNEGIHK